MTWVSLRLGLPNSAAIIALALVPIIALALDRTGSPETRVNIAQAATADSAYTP